MGFQTERVCLNELIIILNAWNSETMNDLRQSFRTQNLKKVCLNCRANSGTASGD